MSATRKRLWVKGLSRASNSANHSWFSFVLKSSILPFIMVCSEIVEPRWNVLPPLLCWGESHEAYCGCGWMIVGLFVLLLLPSSWVE